MKTLAQQNEVYLVPRNGTLESVNVGDHDDLRRMRTELEILRRVARSVQSLRLTKPLESGERFEIRLELFNALSDATNPVVEEVVDLIDKQDPDLRKELFMSVVNEEAENIIQEAIENGVATPADASSPGVTPATEEAETPAIEDQAPEDIAAPASAASTPEDVPVEEALAQAQEELNKAVESARCDDDEAPEEGKVRNEDAESLPESTEQPSIDVTTNTDLEDTVVDNLDEINKAADIEAELDACLTEEIDKTTSGINEVADLCARELVEEPAIDKAPVGDEPVCEEYTADKASAAVEEIERGIRKLADVLNNDVSTQWKQAQDAFGEVMEARTKAGTLHQEATKMAREIARLKEEIEIARDDADVARRETKLMREDALQAKHRAEDLAEAAKRFANGPQALTP